jgi:hypothetical protein
MIVLLSHSGRARSLPSSLNVYSTVESACEICGFVTEIGVHAILILWDNRTTSTSGDGFMPAPSPKRTVSPPKSRRPIPASTVDFDTVRKIGLALPGVEDSTAYGAFALKVHGKLLACVATNRSAEPGSLVVRVDFDDRAELLAADPDVYYVTDHYVPYNAVLVRLSRVNPDVLRDLLGMAHKFVTRNAPAQKRRKRSPGKRKKV